MIYGIAIYLHRHSTSEYTHTSTWKVLGSWMANSDSTFLFSWMLHWIRDGTCHQSCDTLLATPTYPDEVVHEPAIADVMLTRGKVDPLNPQL